ncbi:MAG: hypothetical protein ACR2LM_06835 [Pyrinomonadaceae bacterium]
MTQLRFRIIDITTTNSPGAGLADVRALSSLTATVTTSGGPVPVQGITLEQPPTQRRRLELERNDYDRGCRLRMAPAST